jgi:hypothetical protein
MWSTAGRKTTLTRTLASLLGWLNFFGRSLAETNRWYIATRVSYRARLHAPHPYPHPQDADRANSHL